MSIPEFQKTFENYFYVRFCLMMVTTNLLFFAINPLFTYLIVYSRLFALYRWPKITIGLTLGITQILYIRNILNEIVSILVL